MLQQSGITLILSILPHTKMSRSALSLLIVFQIGISVVSLVLVAGRWPNFISFSNDHLRYALVAVLLVSPLAVFFVYRRFNFGYLVCFFFFTVILNFVWISYFSTLQYDHTAARVSAVLSLMTFALSATQDWKLPIQKLQLNESRFKILIVASIVFALAVLVIAYSYGYVVTGISTASEERSLLKQPLFLRYLIPLCTCVVLPFIFATFFIRGQLILAGATALIIFAFYPVTLSKIVLLTPLWLGLSCMLVLLVDAKATTALLLAIPACIGILLYAALGDAAVIAFGPINLRLFAIPASALDHYNDFFARHPQTFFCQIRVVRELTGCVYQDDLGVVFAKEYALGNFNASLFATEGIASVGIEYAPITTFLCGAVIAIGNSASIHLPRSLVLISSSIFVLVLLNAPLATSMLTYGGIVLFCLWTVAPSSFFQRSIKR